MQRFVTFLKQLTYRHQAPISTYRCIKGGIKGMFTVLILSLLSDQAGVPFLMAPFGASCILVYTTPEDEFAQPINIIVGYFIAGLVSLLLLEFLPHAWWTVGLMVGLSITLMALLRVTHPPAGAVPIVMFFARDTLNAWFLMFPLLDGSLVLVITAFLVHRIPPQREYPRKL